MSRRLSAGEHVGPYELLAPIGEGGMGQVWKARDSRLNRSVAIKFSKQEFNERFTREAHTVAALNHPHICTLHDVGPDYLVMEHVEGAPLHGPLPVEKVVQYAGQILDALEAAHRKGIIHRDLKPANILLTKQGIKLLDFGLAKHSARLHESDETLTEALTGEGRIVGTLQYMAPEQLQGKSADARSDLFSFGCVLYEMLTGKRAFTGESPASVIAAILEREPAPLDVAPPLERVVRTCLKKDPDERFQTAIDLKRTLEWAVERGPAPEQPSFLRGWRAVAAAAAFIAVVVAAWMAGRAGRTTNPPRVSIRRVTRDGQSYSPALSPDAKLLAYSSRRAGRSDTDLFVQQLDGQGIVRLTNHPATDSDPVFSADGSKIYFASARKPAGIYEVPALGGDARLVVANGTFPSVSPDGKWLAYWAGMTVMLRPLTGGESRPLVELKRGYRVRLVWSPDSTRIALQDASVDRRGAVLMAKLDGSATKSYNLGANLQRRGMYQTGQVNDLVSWLPDDTIFFKAPMGSAINVFRLPFRQIESGDPVPVTMATSDNYIAADVRGDKVAFTRNSSLQSLWMLPADLDGGTVAGPFWQLTRDRADIYHQDVTLDGRLLAFVARRGATQGLWLRDLKTGEERLLADNTNPREAYAHMRFSPDGTSIATWHSSGMKILDVATGEAREISRKLGRIRGWSPDGKYLVLWSMDVPSQVQTLEAVRDLHSTILRHPTLSITEPRLSPNGKWIVFRAGASLYFAPFHGSQPIGETEWVKLSDRAGFAFWSPNGRNVYYITLSQEESGQSAMMRQPFDPENGRLQGTAAEFRPLEGMLLGNPVVNQVIGAPGGVVLGILEESSDIWVQDLATR
jgi:serine/threonine protein kinase